MLKFVRNGKVIMEMKDNGELKVEEQKLKEQIEEKRKSQTENEK